MFKFKFCKYSCNSVNIIGFFRNPLFDNIGLGEKLLFKKLFYIELLLTETNDLFSQFKNSNFTNKTHSTA